MMKFKNKVDIDRYRDMERYYYIQATSFEPLNQVAI